MRILRLHAVIPWHFGKKQSSSFCQIALLPGIRVGMKAIPQEALKSTNLIKRVKKKEVQKQGAVSESRRAITEDESWTMQNLFLNQDRSSLVWHYGLYALTNFQFHLIARIDDTTQVLVDNVCIHDNSCNALKTRLNLSENVTEERDAPWQVVLGSMDTAFRVLTSLALWMELNHREDPNAALSPYLFSFSDDVSIPKSGQKSKETA
jgi:hypothetical protein